MIPVSDIVQEVREISSEEIMFLLSLEDLVVEDITIFVYYTFNFIKYSFNRKRVHWKYDGFYATLLLNH